VSTGSWPSVARAVSSLAGPPCRWGTPIRTTRMSLRSRNLKILFLSCPEPLPVVIGQLPATSGLLVGSRPGQVTVLTRGREMISLTAIVRNRLG
jgi:hypothetical protein